MAACVASCRVFLSLSARCSARVKMSLVGLISGLSDGVGVSACRSDARRGSPALFWRACVGAHLPQPSQVKFLRS